MKRFRMFAGPNGSGKSTLIKEISKDCFIGSYINADEIERKLNETKFIDCNDYLPVSATQEDWNKFKAIIKQEDKRITHETLSSINIKEGVIVIETPINSYIASIIAEFFRFVLIECDKSFSFETVMSHPSKVSFLKKAKENGFKTYLYFISTQDPSININRVKIRVSKGGHNVEEDKIQNRYYKSMELLCDAFLNADRAYIIDNSTDNVKNVLVEKKGKNIKIYSDEMPEWVQVYLLEKIEKE